MPLVTPGGGPYVCALHLNLKTLPTTTGEMTGQDAHAPWASLGGALHLCRHVAPNT